MAGLLPASRFMRGPAQLAAYESDGLTAFHVKPLAIVVPRDPGAGGATARVLQAPEAGPLAGGSHPCRGP